MENGARWGAGSQPHRPALWVTLRPHKQCSSASEEARAGCYVLLPTQPPPGQWEGWGYRTTSGTAAPGQEETAVVSPTLAEEPG